MFYDLVLMAYECRKKLAYTFVFCYPPIFLRLSMGFFVIEMGATYFWTTVIYSLAGSQ